MTRAQLYRGITREVYRDLEHDLGRPIVRTDLPMLAGKSPHLTKLEQDCHALSRVANLRRSGRLREAWATFATWQYEREFGHSESVRQMFARHIIG